MGDLRQILVKDYMTASLLTFTPKTDILEAIRLLVERRISGAPVIDNMGHIVGLLSEKDCLKVALNAAYHGVLGGRVEEFMARNVQTVEFDTSIIEVAERFLNSPFKRYPVIRDQRLVGQISRSDVLRAIDALSG